MAFRLEIETGNDAFADGQLQQELARILRELSKDLEQHDTAIAGRVRDINGNTVGQWTLTK